MYTIAGCSGIHRNRVKFLCSSSWGDVFCISAEKSIYNIEMFQWLLSSAYAAFSLSASAHLTERGLGVHKELVGDTAGTADPNWSRGYSIPQCIMLSIWSWRKKKEGSLHSEWQHLSSQIATRCDGAVLSQRWQNACLPMGSTEWIPCFAWFACSPFALTIKQALPQPTGFLTFSLPNLSPVPPGEFEWAAVWVLSCQLGLNHDTIYLHYYVHSFIFFFPESSKVVCKVDLVFSK